MLFTQRKFLALVHDQMNTGDYVKHNYEKLLKNLKLGILAQAKLPDDFEMPEAVMAEPPAVPNLLVAAEDAFDKIQPKLVEHLTQDSKDRIEKILLNWADSVPFLQEQQEKIKLDKLNFDVRFNLFRQSL